MQGIVAPGNQGPSGYQPWLTSPEQHTTGHRRPDKTRAIQSVSPKSESTGESLCVHVRPSRVWMLCSRCVCDQQSVQALCSCRCMSGVQHVPVHI